MKHSKYINLIYILGTLCITVIVICVVNSQRTIIASDMPNDNYGESDYEYYEDEEYEEDIGYDEGNQGYNSDNSTKKSSSKKTSSRSSKPKQSSKKSSSSKETSSKKTSSKKASSKKTSSKKPSSQASRPSSVKEEYTGPVNINTASFEQLCSLYGIGEITAQNIIDFRNEAGGFNSIEEIMYVNGIGEKKFEAIKDRLTLE